MAPPGGIRPLLLSVYSSVSAGRVPRTKPGLGDVLVDNDPYNKEYRLAVSASSGRVLYDLPARCEPRGAIAVPVNRVGEVALIRQWRPVPASTAAESCYPLDEASMDRRGFWSWELPRGFPNKGESGADAARRETQEETNLTPVYVKPLGWLNFNTSVMLSDQPLYFVKVKEREDDAEEYAEDGEHIEELQWCKPDLLRKFVCGGSIRCSITLAGLAYVLAGGVGPKDLQSEEFEVALKRLTKVHAVLGELFKFLESFYSQAWEVGMSWDVWGIRTIEVLHVCVSSMSAYESMTTALLANGASHMSAETEDDSHQDQTSEWEVDVLQISALGLRVEKLKVTCKASSPASTKFLGVLMSCDKTASWVEDASPKVKWTTALGNLLIASVGHTEVTLKVLSTSA